MKGEEPEAQGHTPKAELGSNLRLRAPQPEAADSHTAATTCET